MPLPRLNLARLSGLANTHRAAACRIPLTSAFAARRHISGIPKGATTIPHGIPLLDWEKDLKAFLDRYPGATKFYTNPDNSTRIPTDEELQGILRLQELVRAGEFEPRFTEYFKLPASERAQYINQVEAELKAASDKVAGLFDGEGVIVDKIPVVDHNGNLDWEVLRKPEREGWENTMYYGYLPVLGFIIFYLGFIHKDPSKHWALEELRLQTEEKYLQDQTYYHNLTPEQQLEKDAIVVEKILAGNYDELVSH